MRIAIKSALFVSFAALLLAACVTVPQTGQSSIWPQQKPYITLYYQLQQIGTADEAVGTIKNLQRDFVEWAAGIPFSNIDVDPYGLRAKWEWTETSQTTAYVPSYGGMFVGWNYVPIYGGSYQTQTSSQQKNDMLMIPFNEIRNVALYHMPDFPREYKWGMDVWLQNDRRVSLRVSNELYLKKLSDAIVTLAIERGVQFNRHSLGCEIGALTPEQSQKMGITPGAGLLVHAVSKNSPAEKAGIRFLDVLLEFDSVPLATGPDIIGAVQNATGSGQTTVPVKLLRLEKVPREVIDPNTNKVLKTEMVEKPVEKTVQVNFAS
ncbi:MAG: PDZ domain-containing protein [Gammaproteobacteria bacterium]|nr:PDZ domain-containing protein [Gammaproteobacteria bacterium]